MLNKVKIWTMMMIMLVATLLALAAPVTAMGAGLTEGVAPDGTVTSAWGGVTWPPVISGWTWSPVDGNFGFQTTSPQEKWIHPGDEYAYYTSDPAMTAENSVAWIKYALNHGGGKTLPFSWKFYWAPTGSGSIPGYDPSKTYVAYATVTPQIAQLLAANGLTLAELQSGNPLDSTPTPVSAPAKVATVTPTSTPASTPAKTDTSATTATPVKASTSTQKVAATLPTPPAKGDLSPAANPDSKLNQDIQTYDTNAAKVKAQAAIQAKAAAQQKKVRTYELWVIAGLAVLLVVLLGIGWVRKRNSLNQQ